MHKLQGKSKTLALFLSKSIICIQPSHCNKIINSIVINLLTHYKCYSLYSILPSLKKGGFWPVYSHLHQISKWTLTVLIFNQMFNIYFRIFTSHNLPDPEVGKWRLPSSGSPTSYNGSKREILVWSVYGIPYGPVSSAHLQAHNHLGRHQEDEGLIYKHGHQDKLQLMHQINQFHAVCH